MGGRGHDFAAQCAKPDPDLLFGGGMEHSAKVKPMSIKTARTFF
jgi:hypothetical protein